MTTVRIETLRCSCLFRKRKVGLELEDLTGTIKSEDDRLQVFKIDPPNWWFWVMIFSGLG